MHAPDTPDPGPVFDGRPGAAREIGRVLVGRYRVERVLGRGGMGEVLLAHDTLLRRPVALKHLRADGPQAADMRHAILTEARRASQVRDHRIAAIHDVLDLGDDVLIVMEYVEGETLRECLREPLPLETFWRLARECVEALRAAHAQGVIHRDIKPENLMLTRGQEIKILDFGVALRSERHPAESSPDDSTTSLEQSRRPAGTPRYMAPEAHYGGHIDERTDLFSLGAVFYEMLTARHPFAGGGYATVLDHIMNTVPEPVSRLNPAVSEALSGVIERMLARDPALRYASCDELAAALRTARDTDAGAAAVSRPATPDPIPTPGSKSQPARPEREAGSAAQTRVRAEAARRARRVMLIVVGLGLAAAAVVAWVVLGPPPLPKARNLALLLPATPGGDPEFAGFALGSMELLASRLQRHQDDPRFQLAPFSESRTEQLASVPDARRRLGANLALVSRFEQKDNSLAARLELREPVRGRLLGASRIVVPRAQLLAFADSLYGASLKLLNLPFRRPGAFPDIGVRGAGTLRYLAQGIGRAHSAVSEEELARARADLETASRMEPEAAVPRAWLASSQLRLYERTKAPSWLSLAEASARKAVELDGQRAEAHRVLGEVLLQLRRPADAREECRVACELDPTRDDAWKFYGRSEALLGDAAGERAVYLAAIERRPHAYRPRWWLAHLEYRLGRVEEAIAAYREMIRRGPEFAKGYSALGGILVLRGEYARGIDTLQRALAIGPLPSAYANLGTAYFNTGRLDACVALYNQAFQFGEESYMLWYNLGDAYYWLRGRPDQARDAFSQMARIGREQRAAEAERGDPPDPLIPAYLASAFPKLDHPDSARVYLALATATDSTHYLVQYLAALTHWQLGERARALDWLERTVAGGYPLAWLRDSPVHREWLTEPRFTALLANAGVVAAPTRPPK